MSFLEKVTRSNFNFMKIRGQIDAAAKRMSKLRPSMEKDKVTLQQIISEFKEGINIIAVRQKHIWITDQSEHHWEAADDTRFIEKMERTTEQLVNQKKRRQ